jgi:hypothetical protein
MLYLCEVDRHLDSTSNQEPARQTPGWYDGRQMQQ